MTPRHGDNHGRFRSTRNRPFRSFRHHLTCAATVFRRCSVGISNAITASARQIARPGAFDEPLRYQPTNGFSRRGRNLIALVKDRGHNGRVVMVGFSVVHKTEGDGYGENSAEL